MGGCGRKREGATEKTGGVERCGRGAGKDRTVPRMRRAGKQEARDAEDVMKQGKSGNGGPGERRRRGGASVGNVSSKADGRWSGRRGRRGGTGCGVRGVEERGGFRSQEGRMRRRPSMAAHPPPAFGHARQTNQGGWEIISPDGVRGGVPHARNTGLRGRTAPRCPEPGAASEARRLFLRLPFGIRNGQIKGVRGKLFPPAGRGAEPHIPKTPACVISG